MSKTTSTIEGKSESVIVKRQSELNQMLLDAIKSDKALVIGYKEGGSKDVPPAFQGFIDAQFLLNGDKLAINIDSVETANGTGEALLNFTGEMIENGENYSVTSAIVS